MKIGVLDIGSTTAQLQVAEAVPGAPPLPTHAFKQRILRGEALPHRCRSAPADSPARSCPTIRRAATNCTNCVTTSGRRSARSDRLLGEGDPKQVIGSWLPKIAAMSSGKRAGLRGISQEHPLTVESLQPLTALAPAVTSSKR